MARLPRLLRGGGEEAAPPVVAAAPEPARTGRFAAALGTAVLAAALGPDQTGNVDPLRHSDGAPDGPPPAVAGPLLAQLCVDPDLEWFYGALDDDASRALMVSLFAFRLLGARKVRLPLADGRMDAAIARVTGELRIEEGSVDLEFLGWRGDRYDLTPAGFPIVLDSHPLNITAMLFEQYRAPGHPEVGVRPGDRVIDGGGCWGDTALYFAHLGGPEGRVRTFEFEPANLRRLHGNLALNEGLRDRIDIDERALWRATGEDLSFTSFGPATNVSDRGGEGALRVPSAAVDTLAAEGALDRVDFLKLDIEGAELEALRGAEATLRRDRPRLAIALYHKPEDWTTIPRFLDGLGLGYRFSLGHFTVHAEETVLFAWT
ncbi:MAG TPA: FkbM family methyltransferase [Baekduia sp.]|jgi:FkbM family methyltransferase